MTQASTPRLTVSIGIDVDSVAGWLGSYGGDDSVADISRGILASEVGVPRLLRLLDEEKIKATWFIPGHSLESFPREMAMVRDAGHEIGLHGYSHENPSAMSVEQQRDVLDKTFKMLSDFCGKPPRGSVAPWWEVSKEGLQLLLDYGIKYDHSHMAHDSQPYYLRDQDTWTCIDYSKPAATWMKPLQKGRLTSMVELPASWYLDDLPPLLFIKKAPNSHGYVNPRDLGQSWQDHAQYLLDNEPGSVMCLTLHPDTSGRPGVLLMLKGLIQWLKKQDGVVFKTMEEMADDFLARNPPTAEQLQPILGGAK